MTKRIFGEGEARKRYIGRRPIALLERLQKSYNCSLAILAGPQGILKRMCRVDAVCVPWWVVTETDIREAQNSVGMPRSLKEALKRVRRNRLDYKITDDVEDFRYFYERFYFPTVTASHGSSALPTAFESRRAEIESGQAELMFVTMNEKPVGGVVLSYHDRVPALRDSGILDGDKELLRTGVSTAGYMFAMDYLKEKGLEKVSLGSSRSFLDDGVLTYKEKFRPKLVETSEECFMIHVSRLCNASRGFLRSSSFITERGGDFQFVFFAENDDDVGEYRSEMLRLSSIYDVDVYSMVDISGRRPVFGSPQSVS